MKLKNRDWAVWVDRAQRSVTGSKHLKMIFELHGRHQPLLDVVADYEMGSSSAKRCSIDGHSP